MSQKSEFKGLQTVSDSLLEYCSEKNIYLLKENSNAFVLKKNSVGHQIQEFPEDLQSKNKSKRWFLYPEEALYLESVIEQSEIQKEILNQDSQNHEKRIRDVYSRTEAGDISRMQFFLNVRKSGKFVRRLHQSLNTNESNSNEYLLYENKKDYIDKKLQRKVTLCHPEQSILNIFFNEQSYQKDSENKDFQSVNKQKNYVCIFSNNDFVFVQKL